MKGPWEKIKSTLSEEGAQGDGQTGQKGLWSKSYGVEEIRFGKSIGMVHERYQGEQDMGKSRTREENL